MKLDSCAVERLIQHGLEILFPNEEEIDQLHQIITTQLSINIITEQSKQIYLKVIQRLYDEDKVEGIVLGCTGNNHIQQIYLCYFLLPRNTSAS
jgi:aspartate/glutamate racemase